MTQWIPGWNGTLVGYVYGPNRSACDVVDEWLDVTRGAVTDLGDLARTPLLDDTATIAASAAIMAVSVVLLVSGERLARPAAALVAGGAGFYASFTMLTHVDDVVCTTRIVVAAIVGAALAMLGACVLGLGMILIGVAAGAGTAHLVLVALPESARMPEVYYSTVAAAGVAGGVLVRFFPRASVMTATAVAGGIGLAYGVHGLALALGTRVPTYGIGAIALTAAVVGVCVQWRCRRVCRARLASSREPVEIVRKK